MCEFVAKFGNTVAVMELLDNDVTSLGCEFLARVLMPECKTEIQYLKLDHNAFGSEGVIQLSKALNMNKTITNLSLTYCNIDAKGARAIFEILIF